MTVGIYVRVSTEEQATEGYSIDNQKERLIAFCKSQGWEEYNLYIDDGHTGTKMDRPALKRMIRNIESGKLKAVVVYKLDRLSRKQKDVLYLLEDVFEKHGVAFKSATEPFDTASPFGKAMIGVLAVFAQLERDMIVERTTSGRRQRVSQGSWYGGQVPFGYNWNKEVQMLEIVPDEALIIKEIFNRYLQSQSRLAIAEWVSNRTKARVFDHSTIRDIISRPIYMGKLINAGVIVDGKHEAIIDQEKWLAAQRETNRRKDGANMIGEYLLTGLLECGVCGSNVVHVKRKTVRNGKTYLYELYACKNQHIRAKDRIVDTCNLGYKRREIIESFVEDEIKSIGLDRNKLNNIVSERAESKDEREVINVLQEKLNKVNIGLENLYEAIQSGEIKASRVSDRIKSLEEESETLEMQIEELQGFGYASQARDTKEVINFFQEIGRAWDHFDLEERKITIHKLIERIVLRPNSDPDIKWNVK